MTYPMMLHSMRNRTAGTSSTDFISTSGSPKSTEGGRGVTNGVTNEGTAVLNSDSMVLPNMPFIILYGFPVSDLPEFG